MRSFGGVGGVPDGGVAWRAPEAGEPEAACFAALRALGDGAEGRLMSVCVALPVCLRSAGRALKSSGGQNTRLHKAFARSCARIFNGWKLLLLKFWGTEIHGSEP